MLRWKRLIAFGVMFALGLLPTLAGCAPLTTLFAAPQAPEPISHASFCEIARPITWADGDTDATLAQIQEHNAVGVKLCGWGNP
jgi:uncharacterized lipoprotein YajG